ncbi:MAG: YIP1 family protein [Candidatus Micrarchaeota archaeon]
MADFESLKQAYLGIVDKIIGLIPFGRLKLWKEFFFNPSLVVANEKGGIKDRILDLYLMGLIWVILSLISVIPALLVSSIGTEAGIAALPMAIGLMAAILIVVWIAIPLALLLYSLLQFAVAKALGGQGDFRAHLNASVLPGLGAFALLLPIFLLSVPVSWLAALPGISLCISIIQIPIEVIEGIAGLYSLYLGYLAFKEVHKLTMWKTIAVIAIPILVVVIIIGIIVLFVVWTLLNALAAGLATRGPGNF